MNESKEQWKHTMARIDDIPAQLCFMIESISRLSEEEDRRNSRYPYITKGNYHTFIIEQQVALCLLNSLYHIICQTRRSIHTINYGTDLVIRVEKRVEFRIRIESLRNEDSNECCRYNDEERVDHAGWYREVRRGRSRSRLFIRWGREYCEAKYRSWPCLKPSSE